MNPRIKYVAVPRSLLRRMVAGAERNIKKVKDKELVGYYRGRRAVARELLIISDAVPPIMAKSIDTKALSVGVGKP